jgi:hypothetical protein
MNHNEVKKKRKINRNHIFRLCIHLLTHLFVVFGRSPFRNSLKTQNLMYWKYENAIVCSKLCSYFSCFARFYIPAIFFFTELFPVRLSVFYGLRILYTFFFSLSLLTIQYIHTRMYYVQFVFFFSPAST